MGVMERRAIKKRLQYIKNAQKEHIACLANIASEIKQMRTASEKSQRIADALMTIAMTLQLSVELIEKTLEEL